MDSKRPPTLDVKRYLLDHNIDFTCFKHSPVLTCDEASAANIGAKGMEVKNLFLKDAKSRRFYLIIAPATLAINLKQLGILLEEKLKFANESNLHDILGLASGAVSPFGLLNDHNNTVTLILHASIGDSPYVQFHPNINTQTLDFTQSEFRKCLPLFGNNYAFLDF